jgi:MFS family permease
MGVGVGEAGCLPAGHSLIGDMFPRRQRSLAVSIFQCGAVVGTSLGLFIIGLIGQSLGWRAALVWAGAAGLPLALLAWFTMREPPRPQETKPPYDVIVSTLAALLKRPAFVHLTLAYSIGTICTNGLTQWMPAFLMRSYGMTMAEVGAWSGLASAIGGILGLLTGGLAAAWLSKHDPRWELRIPLFAYATYIPIFVLMALSSSAWMALVLKTLAFYVAAIGGGVALSSVQSFAEPNRRATAVSIVLFLSSLLGLGLGPYLVGLVSDLLTPALGRESLRYALLASVVIVIWAVVHFQLALQRSARDRVN